ncbi:LysE family translocator [Martelella alba]|uniref:LysE family translocator n=1 Tax=Martelella alba TaxID=2590451 RepID=A0ABY2SNV3_9HYPH|nr:LysE family translocator [Martelella alba]TKI06974.1 LysE family translocator [Martelella alba]
MPETHAIISLLVTSFVFAFIPGPALLYTAAQTLSRGRRSGLMAALGLHLGGYMHVIAAASGLTLLLRTVPVMYMGVKFAGAAYLMWLGIQMFRRRSQAEHAPVVKGAKPAKRAFLESMTVEMLNPKTAIFYLAFLPQFINLASGYPAWLQFAVLGCAVNVIFSSADIVCVLTASVVMSTLGKSNRSQRIMQKLGGMTFMGLGMHLALQRVK